MTDNEQGVVNNSSQAVKAVAEVAKLVIEPVSTVAQTYADNFRMRASAKTEIEVEKLKARARMNLDAELVRHQINKEQILKKAEELLRAQEARKELPPATDGKKIEEDWVFKWASLAKDVSDETVQCLWAKVLAGELVRPGKYSLRLLSTLASLRKADAMTFDRFSNYVWEGPGNTFFQLYSKETDEFLDKTRGINYGFYFQLQNMGLVDASSPMGIVVNDQHSLTALYGAESNSFTTVRKEVPLFRVRLLTGVGSELFSLCSPQPDLEYVKMIRDWAFHNGITPAWSDDCELGRLYIEQLPFPKMDMIREAETLPTWV